MIVPKAVLLWIFVSNIVVCIDAFFVINRPETLKGGKYYSFFYLYENYYKFDTLYNINDDLFVIIQSWLNCCQALISFIAVALCLSACKVKNSIGGILCLIVSVMVFWKTVIFVWYDHDWLSQEAKNYSPQSILCYYFPSSLWVVLPLLSIILISKRMVQALSNNQEKPKQKAKGKSN